MTSTAYRQVSEREAHKERVDPDNRLLGRMPVRRLEAEAIRDALLMVSGKLNPRPFGPAVPVTVDEAGQVVFGADIRDAAGRPRGKMASLGGEEYRRSVYVQVRRSLPLGLFEVFDVPAMEPNCPARHASTGAPQALLMMNNPSVVELADAFARRVCTEAGDEPQAQVRRAWALAFGHELAGPELQDALNFLASQVEHFQADGQADPHHRALASFCHALMSTNAFLYVD
jgi:hypothetical protein